MYVSLLSFFCFYDVIALRGVAHLVDVLESCVWHECLGDSDALLGLEVFEDGCHDAGECECGAVECVAELHFLVRIAVAALEAVCLIGVEVADGADFEPAVLCLAIDFKVVADGGCEALVASAETEDAVVELQLLEQSFHVLEHLSVAFAGVFGRVDADDFYLGKFVQAVQSSHVLAVRACFAAEALGVGAVLDGEVFLVEDDVAVDVGDWHLGGRDEVEVVQPAVVHLPFLVGQLSCSVSRCGIDYRWRHYLCVSCLPRLVEEEVDERSLQLRSLAYLDGESCSCDFHAEVEVYEVVFLGEFPVWELRVAVLGDGVPVAHCVAFLAFAEG